jgi:hypothetical protein
MAPVIAGESRAKRPYDGEKEQLRNYTRETNVERPCATSWVTPTSLPQDVVVVDGIVDKW